ncbi:MAG TPA: hypothetical protein VIM61_16590 [Chthoniobacterales bacterium]
MIVSKTLRLSRFSLGLATAAMALSVAVAASGTGFEESEGLAAGTDIATRAGWKQSTAGIAKVTQAEKGGGNQSLEIAASGDDAAATTTFPIPADGVVFLDFAILPTADSSKTPLSTIDANGAMLGFIKTQGTGRIVALAASDDKGKDTAPNAVDAGHSFEVDERGLALEWMRLTIRENLKARTWDLFVDGKLALIDQPLLGKARPKTGTLSFQASPAGPAYADALSITGENPLFADADKDGIPDSVEKVTGSNPDVEDRNIHVNFDAASSIQQFQKGKVTVSGLSPNINRVIYVDNSTGDDSFAGDFSYKTVSSGPKASLASACAMADENTLIVIFEGNGPYKWPEAREQRKSRLNLMPIGSVKF